MWWVSDRPPDVVYEDGSAIFHYLPRDMQGRSSATARTKRTTPISDSASPISPQRLLWLLILITTRSSTSRIFSAPHLVQDRTRSSTASLFTVIWARTLQPSPRLAADADSSQCATAVIDSYELRFTLRRTPSKNNYYQGRQPGARRSDEAQQTRVAWCTRPAAMEMKRLMSQVAPQSSAKPRKMDPTPPRPLRDPANANSVQCVTFTPDPHEPRFTLRRAPSNKNNYQEWNRRTQLSDEARQTPLDWRTGSLSDGAQWFEWTGTQEVRSRELRRTTRRRRWTKVVEEGDGGKWWVKVVGDGDGGWTWRKVSGVGAAKFDNVASLFGRASWSWLSNFGSAIAVWSVW